MTAEHTIAKIFIYLKQRHQFHIQNGDSDMVEEYSIILKALNLIRKRQISF
mgnify:CR=1 FL=1